MSLEDLAARGYVIDEWKRWQQGDCLPYAVALIRTYPHLRLGAAGVDLSDEHGPSYVDQHFYAHDDTHAYDSAGAHPLPYRGIDGQFDYDRLDESPADHDAVDEADILAALDHIQRHPAFTL